MKHSNNKMRKYLQNNRYVLYGQKQARKEEQTSIVVKRWTSTEGTLECNS